MTEPVRQARAKLEACANAVRCALKALDRDDVQTAYLEALDLSGLANGAVRLLDEARYAETNLVLKGLDA